MTVDWSEKTKRRYLVGLIQKIAQKEPGIIEIPEGLKGFGTVEHDIKKCIACGSCTRMCEDEAILLDHTFDLNTLKDLPADSKVQNRKLLAEFIDKLKVKEPTNPVPVPVGLQGIGTVKLRLSRCIACNECVRICQYEALKMKAEWNLKAILEELRVES